VKRRLAALALLALLFASGLGIKLRYGGGAPFPDRSTAALREPGALQLVAELPTPPGNIAVSAGGRVFFSLHPEAHPDVKLVEWVDGRAVPYPNLAFQNRSGEPRGFRNLLGIRIDRQNRLWTLDNGNHGLSAPRLLAFDLATNRVVHQMAFGRDAAPVGSHFNDLQVSPDGNTVFIADASIFGKRPALVVYDLRTHQARRLLEGHRSVTPDFYTPVVQGRRMELFGLFSIRPGIDSIAIDEAGEWLYFAPVTSLSLYRARVAELLDDRLTTEALAGRVQAYADKTMSDGIAIDGRGTLYLTDPEHSAIELLRSDRKLQTLVRDEARLRWPDGFSFGPDGWLYLTCSSLQTVLGRLPSSIPEHAPYQVWRIRAEAPGTPGH
jgi:sugar lactone lactonase YvrE